MTRFQPPSAWRTSAPLRCALERASDALDTCCQACHSRLYATSQEQCAVMAQCCIASLFLLWLLCVCVCVCVMALLRCCIAAVLVVYDKQCIIYVHAQASSMMTSNAKACCDWLAGVCAHVVLARASHVRPTQHCSIAKCWCMRQTG